MGFHPNPEGLGEILAGVFPDVHIEKTVLHIILVQGILVDSLQGHLPFRGGAFRNVYLCHSDILAGYNGHLQMMQVNDGGED